MIVRAANGLVAMESIGLDASGVLVVQCFNFDNSKSPQRFGAMDGNPDIHRAVHNIGPGTTD
jgi:hypothetical protein